MPDITRQLNESVQVVLDADGYGLVRIGPGRAGVRWVVASVAVQVSVRSPMPEFELYLGEPSPGSALGGSYTGAKDAADVGVTLWSGQVLSGEWTGGDPGAVATLSVVGETISTR